MLSAYDFPFPKELIAQEPASPRDASRLLAYDRRTSKASFDVFRNIAGYLPPRAVLVCNETKVVPARLLVRKASGGLARILLVEKSRALAKVLCEKRLAEGSVVSVARDKALRFVVGRYAEGAYTLKPLFPARNIDTVFATYGMTPIPPYIKRTPLSERQLRKKYQAVFARDKGSVAAPTASLHFTKKLLASLRRRGFGVEFITLHVGLGTFAPLTQKHLSSGRLHREAYAVRAPVARRLNGYKKEGRPVIAVGTTVLRALEEAADAKGVLRCLRGETRLFVREGYRFKFTDGLITNFHVPRSSLLMLVSALIGQKKLMELYRAAIRKKFRLFSFGDGMLLT